MGMFDTIKVSLSKLPINEKERKILKSEGSGIWFQTKCFDCVLTEIYITDEGFIMQNKWGQEFVPKKERPHPNDDGLLGMMGSVRRVDERLEPVEMDSDFNFYTDAAGQWFEFTAKVTSHGRITEIVNEATKQIFQFPKEISLT